MATALPAGWYADPADSCRYRYWAGDRWTTHVCDRDAVDIAGARPLPDFDTADGEAAGPSTGRRHRRVPVLLAVLALVAVVATAAVVTLGGSDSSQAAGNTLTGEVRVAIAQTRGAVGNSPATDGTRCGTRAPPGVGARTEVTVSNARGDELRSDRAARRAGRSLPERHHLRVRLCDRRRGERCDLRRPGVGPAPSRMTAAQLESAAWRVDLSIG